MRAGNSDTAGSMTTDGDVELMRSESDVKASPPPVALLICSSDY